MTSLSGYYSRTRRTPPITASPQPTLRATRLWTMASPNSTAASSSGVETEASVGLVGAVLFLIVIVVVCIFRKRQRDAESAECEELSVTSDCRPKNVPGIVGSIYRQTDFKARYRNSGCISIISDANMRIVVEERLIDSARLALGKIIGKGRPTPILSAWVPRL